MEAGDLIRLAWEAEHDGRSRLRDALMTLAVAEGDPETPWARRFRDRLIDARPDHFLAGFSTVAGALQDPRVVEARDRLRLKYPPVRVQSLLLRARAARGPYLGRVESIEAMIEDLVGPVEAGAGSEYLRKHAAEASRGPTRWNRAGLTSPLVLAYSPIGPGPLNSADWPESGPETGDLDEATSAFYLTVLLAIAFLLASVQDDPGRR